MDNITILTNLALRLSTHIFYGVDYDCNVYVYIDRLDGLIKQRIHFPITGRGVTLEDASYNLIKKLLDNNIRLHFQYGYTEGYSTEMIRDILLKDYKIPRLMSNDVIF